MARPIVLSNGELHVGLNNYGLVHDFYYPYVGLENHAAGKSLRHQVGVWIDGKISWLDDGAWELSFHYPHNALIGHTVATNASLGVRLEFDDAVDAEVSGFMRSIHVINMAAEAREIRLFLHQAFVIGDSRSNTDTAQYLPDVHGVLHYRGRRAFIVSARFVGGSWFDQHSIGLFDIEGHEGTYRDADDGELSMCPVEHGRVDSTLRLVSNIKAHESARVEYWVTCGTSTREALYVHKKITGSSIGDRLDITTAWWRRWLEPAFATAKLLPEYARQNFIVSAMIVKAHIDNRGAVIASSDSAMLNYSRDTYAYCWPRDGANAVWPLIRMGYRDEPHRFFDFCRRGLNPSGFLMHKYRADGALGSSWHPYVHEDGVVAPPIQEDETALVLFVFGQFYHQTQDEALLKEFYEPLVVPMADFLAGYVDHHTGLPKPSYDLWEERFATFTYTVAVTHAALVSAAELAEVRGDKPHAVAWRSAAEDIRAAAAKHLYNSERKAFYKSVSVTKDGEFLYDDTLDMSSLFGAFIFGLFPPHGQEVQSAVETARKVFGLDQGTVGLPRYEHDTYRREHDDVLGNWWPIATLWMAQYYNETGDTKRTDEILRWVGEHALQSKVMSEQIDPVSEAIISVAPLAWSHAEYMSTLLDTITNEDAGL